MRRENVEKIGDLLMELAAPALRAAPRCAEAVAVGAALSLVLERNPSLRQRLGELAGKVFFFSAKDIKKDFYLVVTADGVAVRLHCARKPDVTMRGDVKVLLGLVLGAEDPDTVFFSRRLEISGDTAAAIHLKNILASL
ncbi:MAG TPA: SCP2 sterol-binding domain-containing protein [Deltaproteobacteria bacterium]|nr:SCP2 sterol-binding domain-containing protein [Deltaproteobacteria bacterium]